jgi:Carboxypeptidase regulatory-like domain
MKSLSFAFRIVLAAFLIGVTPLSAQSTYGTILGTVKDSSGATVPDASVKITNVDENTIREVKTNSNGDYEAPNLLPAHYRVDVELSGFQTFNATDLSLIARQTLRVDATLQVGTTQQSVTVNESEAGVIATDTQTIQATFDRRALLNL